MKELKECPFCGVEGRDNVCNSYFIEFFHKKNCFLGEHTFITLGVNGDVNKIKAWNTRSETKEVGEDCQEGSGTVLDRLSQIQDKLSDVFEFMTHKSNNWSEPKPYSEDVGEIFKILKNTICRKSGNGFEFTLHSYLEDKEIFVLAKALSHLSPTQDVEEVMREFWEEFGDCDINRDRVETFIRKHCQVKE